MAKYCLLVFLIVSLLSIGQSREVPLSGNYIMKVKIKSLDGTPIGDYQVIYDSDTLKTDSLGFVDLTVSWSFYRFIKKRYRRRYNKILNGKYIFFRGLNGDKYFVKNKWRKYGLKSRGDYYEVDVYSRVYNRF